MPGHDTRHGIFVVGPYSSWMGRIQAREDRRGLCAMPPPIYTTIDAWTVRTPIAQVTMGKPVNPRSELLPTESTKTSYCRRGNPFILPSLEQRGREQC